MSTPQTLTQALPPHQHLDHRQRYLPSPQDRYLPPPRPSSNLSNSFHQNIPARPSSNLSNHQLPPPPPRTQSGMSNGAYSNSHAHSHTHSQTRGGAEQSYANGLAQQSPHGELRRTNSRASQHQRPLPPPPQPSRAQNGSSSHMPSNQAENSRADDDDRGGKRRKNSSVDWVSYFGGKPPEEIITIHDDDSPAPTAEVQRLPPPTNDSSSTQHANKKRRRNAGNGEANYSATNTPYSHSNGTSTESLQATTAPTSLGSQASSGSRLEGTQTGQKRKRSTRTAEQDRKKPETEQKGPKGYLAEYGEYVPPPKQHRKQKEVHVPAIHDVWHTLAFVILTLITNHTSLYSVTRHMTRSMTRMAIMSYKRIVGSASDTVFCSCSARARSARW